MKVRDVVKLLAKTAQAFLVGMEGNPGKSPLAPLFQRGEIPPFGKGRSGRDFPMPSVTEFMKRTTKPQALSIVYSNRLS